MNKKQKVKYGKGDNQIDIEIDDNEGDKYNLDEIIKQSIMTIVHNLFNRNKETGEFKTVYNINTISMDFYLQHKYTEKEGGSFDSIPFFNPEDKDKNGHPIVLMMKLNPQFLLDETKTRMQIKLLKSKGVPDSRIELIKKRVLEGHQENNPNANDPSQYKIFPDFFPYVYFNGNEIPRKKTTIYDENFTIYSISTILSASSGDPMLNMMFIQNCVSHLMENIPINNNSKITYAYVLEGIGGIKLNLFIAIDNSSTDLID
jgi:hypothetical protein